MQHLEIQICDSPEEAEQKGFVYREDFTELKLKKAVVVRNGMVSGKPSVDFVMEDENGKKYVFMTTGALVKSIPC